MKSPSADDELRAKTGDPLAPRPATAYRDALSGPRRRVRPMNRTLSSCLVLVALVAVVYGRTLGHGFVSFDDDLLLTENPPVQVGLTGEGLRWAWTTGHAANWMPLVWMSHLAEVSVFGLDARGFHLTNLVLHAANVLLLFAALRTATGSLERSFWAAALYAVHPLEVESVAWIAERKGLLASTFGLAALLAYVRCTPRSRTPAAAPVLQPMRLVPVALLLAASLLSKQMLVTLPFVLLLLDAWPLGRFDAHGPRPETGRRRLVRFLRSPPVLEKLPLLALCAAMAVVAFLVQRAGGTVRGLVEISPTARAANALAAYGLYVRRTLWPAGLAPHYAHPGESVPTDETVFGLVVLAAGFLLAWSSRRRCPAVAVGWLWFVGTLVPVLQFVPLGNVRMADRYAAFPLIGLALAVVRGAGEYGARLVPRAETVGRALAAAVVLLLAGAAFVQVGHWKDDATLFAHAASVPEASPTMISMHANVLAAQGRTDEARAEFVRSLRTEFALDRRNRAQSGPFAAWILRAATGDDGDSRATEEPDSLVVRIDVGRLRAGETFTERDLAGSGLRRADGLVAPIPAPGSLFFAPQSDRLAYVLQPLPTTTERSAGLVVRIRCPKIAPEPVEFVLRPANP